MKYVITPFFFSVSLSFKVGGDMVEVRKGERENKGVNL